MKFILLLLQGYKRHICRREITRGLLLFKNALVIKLGDLSYAEVREVLALCAGNVEIFSLLPIFFTLIDFE